MHALECLKLVGAGTPLQKNPEFCWGLVRFLARSLRSLAALARCHLTRTLASLATSLQFGSFARFARSFACVAESSGVRLKGTPSLFFYFFSLFISFFSFFPFFLFFLFLSLFLLFFCWFWPNYEKIRCWINYFPKLSWCEKAVFRLIIILSYAEQGYT